MVIIKDKISSQVVQKWTDELLKSTPTLLIKLNKLPIDSSIQSKELLTEVIRFLSLVSMYQIKLSPSHTVDLAWHEFILFTRAYDKFCHEKLGRFIHHTPDDNTQSNHRNYLKTIQHYIYTFGQPPTSIWGKEAEDEWNDSQCGSCSTL